MKDDGKLAAVNFLARCDHRCTCFSVGVNIGLFGFSESDQHGFSAFGAHEGHGGVGFGLEVSITKHAIDLAFERRWNTLDDFG